MKTPFLAFNIIFLLALLVTPVYPKGHPNDPDLTAEKPPIFRQSFDEEQIDFKRASTAFTASSSLQRVYQSTYTTGIRGRALDLSSDAPFRTPHVLKNEQQPTYSENQSFSLIVWVKTKPGARQGQSIWTNKQNGSKDAVGWTLGTQDNGSWRWNMSDGRVTYNYEPTAEKQGINDGEWHQLALSIDRNRDEVWMYKDGKNVAIYQIEQADFGSLQSNLRTILGGSDEYYDLGSQGEWMAFNGLLDEATLFDYALSQTEIQADYEEITGIKLNAAGPRVDRLKVQVWNIWHGGHRFGEHVGVERTCEILKETNADIIGLIETYGSGAIIADSLGYYFYLVGTNLSIMSRYPIEETISVYEPFYSGGAIINLGEDQKIAFFDTWLWYQPGFPPISKWAEPETLHEFHEAEKRRVGEIENILKGIRPYVDNSDSIPVIMVGDFNSSSHLDHTEETAPLYGNIILDRPVSKLMINAGFKDSYRESHPSPAMNPGYTWSPLYNENGILKNEGRLSRIDYIYYQGEMLQPYHAVTLDYHPIFWPSDHASVITSFYLN